MPAPPTNKVKFMSDKLFEPMRLGRLALPNRIIMAPMNRARCDESRAPRDRVGEYHY